MVGGRLGLVALAAALLLAAAPSAEASPEKSVAKCQAGIGKHGARYAKHRMKFLDKCLKKTSSGVLKGKDPSAKRAKKCVKAFRKLNDSRAEKKDAGEKFRKKLARRCDPDTRPHSLGDLLGPSDLAAESLDVSSLDGYCESFGGDGSIDSLDEWADCIVAAQNCEANQAMMVRYPRALEWLQGVRADMLLVTPKDPAQVSDAVAELDAVEASLDPDGDDVADLTCGPPVCPSNLLECSDQCVDPNTDENHCGACDAVCGPGTVCTGGLCQ